VHHRAAHSLPAIAVAALALLSAACGGTSPSALPMPAGARALAVAPDFAGTLWAPANGRDYRSQDGGHTWQRVYGPAGGDSIAFTEKWAYLPGARGAQISDFGGRLLSPSRPTPARFISVASPYHRTNRLYALDDQGGLWLSIAAGRRWMKLRAEGLPAHPVSIAAVRDLITEPDTIYVSAGSDGLWRSRDFGATFSRVAGVAAADAVALTTDDQRLILVADGKGLLLSTDRGGTFRRVSDLPARAVAFDPRNHRLAYAAVGGRLLRSVDGGRTWPGPPS
jgi:photosystem II stability/assembly factor-like uncharacterized protein